MSDCEHPDFIASARVDRLTDGESSAVRGYHAEFMVRCQACGQQFVFIGLPTGLSPMSPTVSPDGLELRAPIGPADKIPSPMDEMAAQLREPKDVN